MSLAKERRALLFVFGEHTRLRAFFVPDKCLQQMLEVKQTGAMTYQDHKQAFHHMLTVSAGIDIELGHAV